jgi:cholesterol transport system auxiliary component
MKILKVIGFILISAFSMILSACGLMSPAAIESPTLYVLKIPTGVAIANHQSRQSILILPTQTMPPYDTKQFAYTTSNQTLNYFSKSQWAATPSQMLTNLLVQSFQNAHLYRAVLTTPFSGNVDERLTTQLLLFQQEFNADQSQFHLIVAAQLTAVQTNKILASQQWDLHIPAQKNNPAAGAAAANQAAYLLIKNILSLCLEHHHY